MRGQYAVGYGGVLVLWAASRCQRVGPAASERARDWTDDLAGCQPARRPSVERIARRSERRFVSLGAVFCVYYAISYGFARSGRLRTSASVCSPTASDAIDLAPLPLGILAWFAGYRLVHAPALTRAIRRLVFPERTAGPVNPATLMAIYATTVLIRFYLIGSGSGYGYLQNAEAAATSASSHAAVCGALRQIRPRAAGVDDGRGRARGRTTSGVTGALSGSCSRSNWCLDCSWARRANS